MQKTSIAVANTKKPFAPERKSIERPHRGLTKTQEEISDLASDILLNGGAREDLDLILMALARHRYRNMSFSRGPKTCASEVEKQANRMAPLWRESWYQDLNKQWSGRNAEPANKKPYVDPKTVTEMVRADIRTSVQDKFEDFLTDAIGIEPVWLLNEVLDLHNSGGDLAEAFCYALSDAPFYIRVPSEHLERVKEFVAILENEEAE